MENLEERYHMNRGVLTEEEMKRLKDKKVLIVGCGGLGGNVANQMVRLGVGNLTLVDFDVFSISNLNRQLFSNTDNIGEKKVEVLQEELRKINPTVFITSFDSRIQNIEVPQIDYIVDCVDNIETKIYLSKLSQKRNVPLLHGSCGGWYGQVGWISPNSPLIEEMYESGEGLEKELLNPVFAPSVVSSYMVSEFTKMIKNQSLVVMDELLLIDLYNNAILRTKG